MRPPTTGILRVSGRWSRHRPRLALAALLATSAALTTGCSFESHAGGPAAAGATLAPGPADAPAAGASASTAPDVESGPAPEFGRTFTYAAGLKVKVAAPEAFTPSPWIEPEAGTPMYFVVVIHNRTGEEWNPSRLHLRLTSAFRSAIQIYDADKGIVARPEERLQDGDTVRFSVGYWVTDPDLLSLELEPGFGYATTTLHG